MEFSDNNDDVYLELKRFFAKTFINLLHHCNSLKSKMGNGAQRKNVGQYTGVIYDQTYFGFARVNEWEHL